MPPCASSNSPARSRERAGERAACVAEQLGLDEFVGKRRAVHVAEAPFAARAQVMDGAGDQLLPDAALPFDQHTERCGGRAGNRLPDLANRRADSDQFGDQRCRLRFHPRAVQPTVDARCGHGGHQFEHARGICGTTRSIGHRTTNRRQEPWTNANRHAQLQPTVDGLRTNAHPGIDDPSTNRRSESGAARMHDARRTGVHRPHIDARRVQSPQRRFHQPANRVRIVPLVLRLTDERGRGHVLGAQTVNRHEAALVRVQVSRPAAGNRGAQERRRHP